MSVTPRVGSFTDCQYRFAAYIRDPENSEIPDDVEKRRMDLYRELMFNNVDSVLSTSFPVLRRIVDKAYWIGLVQDFFATHRSSSPYFSEVPEEFLDFLQNERAKSDADPPFLLELAHYEWVELALVLARGDDKTCDNKEIPSNLVDLELTVSDVAWPLVYRYPVHKISTSFKPMEPPGHPTYLVVYRDPEDEVRFMEINGLTYRLLQLLDADSGIAASDCLKDLTAEFQLQSESLFEFGIDLLENLWIRGIVHSSR